LGISLFVSQRFYIFFYYIITVSTFLVILHYSSQYIQEGLAPFFYIVLGCFVVLSALFISKLSIDPLVEHIHNLQALSKETLHELNLPISTIVANVEMIKKNVEDEKTLKRIARIQSACGMLEKRYNELDYMIKKQSMQEFQENIALDTLIQSRISFLKHLYPDVEFHIQVEATTIFCDRIGLEKVIDNLIDNGIKYSRGRSKDIVISLQDKELSIEDFGCGIDEVELVKIFDRYYQSNKSIEGFGIGLSMVKRFCDKNGIELTIKSQLDKGTKVQMRFK
jgi:signal transduction histidine kinase